MATTSAAQRLWVESCNHPLTRGRSCCHARGHEGRHSHTWQRGDARSEHIGDYLLNMETGEVIGDWPDDTSRIIAEVHSEPHTREDALRVLRNQLPGFKEPVGPLPALDWDDDMERYPMDNITFHYHGQSGYSYGVTSMGHDVSVSPAGKVDRLYSINQRREAVEYARRFGAAKAARKFDIPAGSIRSWMVRG